MTKGSLLRIRLGLALLVLALAGVGLAGCGGSDTTTDGTTHSVTGAAETEPDAGESDYEGGEESIEEFGTEAAGAAKQGVLTAEQGYLTALADGDYAKACTFVASSVTNSLQQVVPPGEGERSCAEILPKLLSSSAPAVARQQLEGEVVKVRVDGSRGFVVYHAPGARLYTFPVTRDGAVWKVSTLTGSILVPPPATLGE